MINLTTYAEAQAQKAEDLPAFSGIKLLHIKRQVGELLGLIGRFFDEYTKHDITHVDEMLKILDWLIPEDTKRIMSPADWLLTVLAIYFHDFGMLVTREEYEKRNSSGFPEYRDTVLFADDSGKDYQAKVKQKTSKEAERFLYQEFVRHKHPERIANWIVGKAKENLGVSREAVSEVDNLLGKLDEQIREDLAFVCESHHRDDLGDFKKYGVSKPYGNSAEQTANLHYIAILLRTTDLLHITLDRTPSITFRAINPTDPDSQKEWAKQMAVKNVRSKIAVDKEGCPDAEAPRNTIEVHAYFTNPDAFFGLTRYLTYAESQLRKSCEWTEVANKSHGSIHRFPWRYIDDSHIVTKGFVRQKFTFTIDQAKILDLLTGHTLYNKTTVVLRELVQNCLDAVRLQEFIDDQNGVKRNSGQIKINWNSQKRVLSVEDNGTGMTQRIIEEHLLKVGASRYQDSEFRLQYPEFSAISRFGIGLLSTFMIADEVEITTCNPDDEEARHLSFRSVHGSYLIRLIDKYKDEVAKRLEPHGTLVKLKIRPSAEIDDIIDTARFWIVIPECEVIVTIDGKNPTQIGYSSPKEALIDLLKKQGIHVSDGLDHDRQGIVKVVQQEQNGVSLAYAVKWSEFFNDWSFLSFREDDSDRKLRLTGTCVEGIRVESSSPGYEPGYYRSNIVAIANAKGPNAPKTNVVRSGIEATDQRDLMLNAIYSMYCKHIETEISELHKKRNFSLTWAVRESEFLIKPLMSGYPSKSELLFDRIKKVPTLLLEREGNRLAVSPFDLFKETLFWTIDCRFSRYAEEIIRETPINASLTGLSKALQDEKSMLPDGPLLCLTELSTFVDRNIFEEREVDVIKVHPVLRRIDCRWVEKADPPRWLSVPKNFWEPELHMFERSRYISDKDEILLSIKRLMVADGAIQISVPENVFAVKTCKRIFLFPENKQISEYLKFWMVKAQEKGDVLISAAFVIYCINTLLSTGTHLLRTNSEKFVFDLFQQFLKKWNREFLAYLCGDLKIVSIMKSFLFFIKSWLIQIGLFLIHLSGQERMNNQQICEKFLQSMNTL